MHKYVGHAPGHVRDMFLNAVDAFQRWNGKGPEPEVPFQIDYKPHLISLSEACGLLWNCTDTMPGSYLDLLRDALGGENVRGTYAGCARAMRTWLSRRAEA